jgi:putative DNA primase/helicase
MKDQPVFYNKNKIWWLWNLKEYRWEKVDETDLLNAIDDKTQNPSVNSKIKYDILEALKRNGRRFAPIEADKNWVQFKDTIVNVQTGERFKADPKYFITNPIPWNIGKSTDTPTIDKIFREWVIKEGIQDESYVDTLYEIMAYCLIPSMPIHRIFCLIGDGLNGKGSFLRLVERLVGEDNKCATEVELLVNNRFESAKLFKKLVCFVGEIDKGIFKKTKTLKSLSGDDLVRFEIKGKDGFDGHNYAKPLIATNHLPDTTDKKRGFYRRWTIVDFPNTFDEQKDIVEDIPDEEIENFCLKSIEILKNLIKRGEFTNDGTVEDKEKKYESHSSMIEDFIKNYCEKGDKDSYFIEFRDFYERYVEYLLQEGMNKKSKMEVSKSLELKGYEKRVKKVKDDLGNVTTRLSILGIRFKDLF